MESECDERLHIVKSFLKIYGFTMTSPGDIIVRIINLVISSVIVDVLNLKFKVFAQLDCSNVDAEVITDDVIRKKYDVMR